MTTISARLIAHTTIDPNALESLGYRVHNDESVWVDRLESDADELAEFAGRNCYLSFSRPNPKTATNNGYLDHILDVGHESVLEHASATFYINASRSVLAELERHRHLSFSVVSQRYVDVSELDWHYPPAVNELDDHDESLALDIIDQVHLRAQDGYKRLVDLFVKAGKPRKQAREAARAVIPNMIDSPMVVSGNMRAWKHVIRMRWHVAADAEIRELAGLILGELRKVAPNTFQDVPETPYGY